MATEPSATAGVLPAELQLLLFRAAGVALGVETAAVARIQDAEQARRSGIACRRLDPVLGPVAAPAPTTERNLLLQGRDGPCWLGIDGLDEIVTLPAGQLQPLPEPLTFFPGPRTFWGGVVRADRIVLLIDADRFPGPARDIDEAQSRK